MPVAYERSRFFATRQPLTSMTDLTKLENHVSRDVYREFGQKKKRKRTTPASCLSEKKPPRTGFVGKLKGLTRMDETLLLFTYVEAETHRGWKEGRKYGPKTFYFNGFN